MRYFTNSLLSKERFYIEPNGIFGWIFRREGSDKIIKRDKYKQLLIAFAEVYCKKFEAEILVCDNNGMLQDIIKFTNGLSGSIEDFS